MAFQNSTYVGDDEYSVSCIGDACVGDHVRFERATFTGSFRNAKFAGFETVTGEIVADSYGRDKQQHTFTVRQADGSLLKIKGRNLYKNGTWRKPWADESARHDVLGEKHARGESARAAREIRRAEEPSYARF